MKAPFAARRVSGRTLALYLAPIVVLGVFVAIYLSGGRYISTENAYVRAGMIMVSANVSGEVQTVNVAENQLVEKGDLLFTIDPAPFDLALASAEAALREARNAIVSRRAALESAQRQLVSAQEVITYETGELKRMQGLIKSSSVSRAKLAERAHLLEVARNREAVIKSEIKRVTADLGGTPDQNINTYPRVLVALAARNIAALNKGYASVTAKEPGIVARIDLHPGEYIGTGAAVFSIVATNKLWIEANVKETRLTNVRVGQRATVVIDAFPDIEIPAMVVGLSPAAGSEYAILPPQNATGNWIKVNQRIPVRLELGALEDLPVLRAGMTVEVTIDTGAQRSFADLFNWLF